MPFNFDLSGRKELQKKLMEQELVNEGLRNQVLQASVDQINPDTERIRSILQQRDQEMDPVARKALEINLSRYGTFDDAALGKVPVFMPSDDVRERRANVFMRGAEDLAAVERQIDLAEQSGDMAMANALRTQRDTFFKNAKDNFKKVPFDKLDELSNRRSFLDAAEKVAELLQKRGSSGLYGPVDSFLGNIGGATGIMKNDDYVALSQAFAATRNALLKELAGSAVTPSEASRQLESIGDLTRQDFGDKFMSFYSQAKRDFFNKVQTLNDAGYQIPDKLVTRSEQGVNMGGQSSASPASPSGQGQGTFQYDPRARRLIPGR